MTRDPDQMPDDAGTLKQVRYVVYDMARDVALRGAMLFGVLILFAIPSVDGALLAAIPVVAAAGGVLPVVAMARKWPRPWQWATALVLLVAEFAVIAAVAS